MTVFKGYVLTGGVEIQDSEIDRLQREMNESIVTVGDLTLLSEMHLSSRQKISEDIVELRSAIHQLI